MKVYVVTGVELGWDCVVAVYSCESIPLAELELEYPQGDFVITERVVEFGLGVS
jgi:hypothetical protein